MAEVYGKYGLLTKIASGGMAEVWLARSSSIGGFEKILAIKRMHSKLCANENFVSMFIEEAKLTVSLNHANIVQIFDFGRFDDNYYIAMEFVDGVDLSMLGAKARKREKPLPVAASVFIMQNVFDGLGYAHRRSGIIHRDISPHNVLVSFEGQIKISDFGIAKAAAELAQQESGEIVGKVAYMSPEQARGEILSQATDIWAAGVILHELLVNTRLFAKDLERDTLKALASDEIPAPSSLNPAVPKELDAVVAALLEREPSQRSSNAREVSERLQDILRTHYPRTNEDLLAETIAEVWDQQLPRILGNPSGRSGSISLSLAADRPPTVEATLPATANTKSAKPSDADMDATQVPSDPQPRRPSLPSHEEHGTHISNPGPSAPPRANSGSLRADVSQEVERLKVMFTSNPNLWFLVDIGDVYHQARETERATFAFRLAAAKFAQHGQLVQASAICCKMLERFGASEALNETIRGLRRFQGLPDDVLLERAFGNSASAGAITEYLAEYRDILESAASLEPPLEIHTPTPILSSLGPEQFQRLIYALRLRSVAAGQSIVREGNPGSSYFWIGRGRVVVFATNFQGRRVYMTALADGDSFGEQSFFTGAPRTATVEAADDVVLLEVGKRALDEVIREFPEVQENLRQFYKERLAEALLARSPLFGKLSMRDRRSMAERLRFTNFAAGRVIISEGEASDAFYAIKEGRVEVFTGPEGTEVPLATLEPGEVFGEVAALKGSPRTASVRATADCELLCLEAAELKHFLSQNPAVEKLIAAQMAVREEERERRTRGRPV